MIDLAAFQVQAATAADAAPRETPEHVLLENVGNALLELGYLADQIAACTARRARIVAKLDDPTITATPAQRGEAEARAGALWNETERCKRQFRELALSIKWGRLPDELRRWIREEVFPLRWYDGVAAFVGSDQTLGGLAVWRELLVGREARKEHIG